MGWNPFAVKEMKALPDGFELVFTKAVSFESLSKGSLSMTSYTYEYSSAYGGDEMNTKELIVKDSNKLISTLKKSKKI